MPIYMKFEGIKGTMTGKYAGWIELDSCQIGPYRRVVNATGGASNKEASKPVASEVVITKTQEESSTQLFRESLNGTPKKVTIDFVDGDGSPYLTIILESALISSISVSGHGSTGRDRLTESLSLNFTKISFITKPADPSKDPK